MQCVKKQLRSKKLKEKLDVAEMSELIVKASLHLDQKISKFVSSANSQFKTYLHKNFKK